jgi:hypothetical protein
VDADRPHTAEADTDRAQAGPLALHIGLPKTATSFLQEVIFQPAADLTYVHREQGEEEQRLAMLLKRLPRFKERKLLKRLPRFKERRLAGVLADLNEALLGVHHKRPPGSSGTTLISDENISVGRLEVWTGEGPSPEQVADRLAALAGSEDLPHRSVSVILGIRRQDQWLGSRYAQSASEFDEFRQSDFDRRMRELCDGELEGPMQWLDYAETRRHLAGALGEENVFIVPMEYLAVAPEEILGRLGSFLGGVELVGLHPPVPEDPSKVRRNVKSVGANTWRLLGGAGSVTLSESLGRELLARFRSSNQELSEEIDIDLGRLGYW